MGDSLEELLSGPVAEAVLRALVRDLTLLGRNGLPVPTWASGVLTSLAALADQPAPAQVSAASVTGHGFATVSGMGLVVPVAEAADLVGRSPRHVRRLAESGKVRSDRVGRRTWLIDVESLRSVIRSSS